MLYFVSPGKDLKICLLNVPLGIFSDHLYTYTQMDLRTEMVTESWNAQFASVDLL